MNRYYRNWSSLPSLAILIMARNLNSVDYACLRSVCKDWKSPTEVRRKAPLVILSDCEDEETVKALYCFDIVNQEIIPFRPLASQIVTDSYYLGSSRGWIFVGKYTPAQNSSHEELMITLINPFTDETVNLPMLINNPKGRVFLLHNPRNLEINNLLTVIYFIDCDYLGQPMSEVNFIELGQQSRWVKFWIRRRPDNVIASESQFFAGYHSVLRVIDLDTGKLSGEPNQLVGFLPPGSTAFPSRYYQNISGGLFVVFSTTNHTYCFSRVSPSAENQRDLFDLIPPCDIIPTSPWRIIVKQDLSVENVFGHGSVHVASFNPSGLFSILSAWWHNGQNQLEPMGWITPDLP